MITRFTKTFLFASCLINTSFTICAMGIIPRVVHDSVFISLFGLSTTPFDSSPLQNKIKHPYLNFGPFINKYFGMSPANLSFMHFFMFMYYFSWSSRVLNVCGSCLFQFLWRFYLDYYGFSCTFKIGVILHIIFRAFVYYKIACYSDWIEVLIFWVWQH